MPERVFLLKPRPPIRAFVIAAVLSLAGGVLTVLALQQGWHPAAILLAVLVLAAGVLLCVAGVVAMGRLGVRIVVDDDGYEISGTGQRHEGKWRDVTKVTRDVDAARFTIYHGNERCTHVIFPGGPAQSMLDDVLDEMLTRVRSARR